MLRTYSELISIPTFEERFRYLALHGAVGRETFGYDRWFNQRFYSSPEWRRLRRDIIIRDNGCDLGLNGYELGDRAYIHHMNPIVMDDVVQRSDLLLNPEYLITVSFQTHQAIHYGDEALLPFEPAARRPNDTCPWRA